MTDEYTETSGREQKKARLNAILDRDSGYIDIVTRNPLTVGQKLFRNRESRSTCNRLVDIARNTQPFLDFGIEEEINNEY